MPTEHYTMSDELANAVAEVTNLSVEEVRSYCLADWSEGQEHQDWLDNASVNEIADWIPAAQASAYTPTPQRPYRIVPRIGPRDQQKLRRACQAFNELGLGVDSPFARVGRNQYTALDGGSPESVARAMWASLHKIFEYDVVWDG